jgi:hypothetical protein
VIVVLQNCVNVARLRDCCVARLRYSCITMLRNAPPQQQSDY